MQNLRILLVDNYDSFTYNLQDILLKNPKVSLVVRRNDEPFLSEIKRGEYDGVVIGPGPGSPEDESYFGFNRSLINDYGTKGLPILGVCLGFQGIWHCLGGKLRIAPLPMHGKVSSLKIKEEGRLLKGIPNGIQVMRYHSIIADLAYPTPIGINILAETEVGYSTDQNGLELMVFEHSRLPLFGIQFHPESFATEYGVEIVNNFVQVCLDY
jgi:anthranilate synthase component II